MEASSKYFSSPVTKDVMSFFVALKRSRMLIVCFSVGTRKRTTMNDKSKVVSVIPY